MYQSSVCRQDFHPQTQDFYRGRLVAVTGGSGFIGSHAVEQLLELGAKPRILTRRASPPFLSHLRERIEIRVADLADAEATQAALDGAEIVVHFAAEVAGIEYNKKHPASIFQNNLMGFMNTIRAAQAEKVERFVTVSSACVYPRHCSLPTPEEEGVVGEPEPTNSGYGWAKRMEEYLTQKYAEEYGLSVAIPRPYNGYGPRDNFETSSSHVIPALIRKAVESQDGKLMVWGDGTHSRSFLYVDDFARGVLEVGARSADAQPLNVGADEEITIRDLATAICDIVSVRMDKKIQPEFQPTGITGQPRRRCDTKRLSEKLGYKTQVELRHGLEKTIDWYLSFGRGGQK